VKEQRVEHLWVGFRQRSQLRREREDDVMVLESWQLAQNGRRPVIGFILSTPGTEAIFARVIDKLGRSALRTLIHIRAQFSCSTCPDLIRGFEDVWRNVAPASMHVLVPVCVQNLSEANHDDNITRDSNAMQFNAKHFCSTP
jgi:hypothetical protein